MNSLLTDQLNGLKNAFEDLRPDNVDDLLNFYSSDASFKDPFQEVQGRLAIKHIFLKMFDQLESPTFQVRQIQQQGTQASLLWEFRFRFKRWNRSDQVILGVSWLYFNESGLIIRHHDFWDPAEGIYEKLPIIGSFLRLLKNAA
jgi:steroid delta-isomerase